MSPQAPLYEAKSKLLRENGILNDTAFLLTLKEPIPEKLLQALRLQRLEGNVVWPEGIKEIYFESLNSEKDR